MSALPSRSAARVEAGVAGLAHDLRNLLTVISAQTDRMALALPSDSELLRAHAAVIEALQRAGEITAELAGAPAPTANPPATPAAAHDGLVLLVDDDRQVRQVLAAMLLAQGFDVTSCASSTEALAQVERGARLPRLAVLDGTLSGQSASALLAGLRQRCPELPVLFVTGSAADGVAALVDRHTARISKPFRAAELSSVVASLLHNGSSCP